MRNPESKILTVDQAAAWRATLRRQRRTLVLTNGCFDLLHRGHVEYLARARECGDALIVAVNSDASVRALKGEGRPIQGETDRAYVLAGLESTDAVVLFATPRVTGLLEALQPDVYVKGGDYTEATLDRDEHAQLKRLGCRIAFVTLVPGLSTTTIIERLRG